MSKAKGKYVATGMPPAQAGTRKAENEPQAATSAPPAQNKPGYFHSASSWLVAAMSAPREQVVQPAESYLIENQTARPLQIELTDKTYLTIAPFGIRKISKQQYEKFQIQPWEDHGLIVCIPVPKPQGRKELSAAEAKVYLTVAVILVGVCLLGIVLPQILIIIPPLKDIGQALLNLYPFFLLFIIVAPLGLAAVYLVKRQTWFNRSGGALALGLVAVSVIAVAAIGPAFIMWSFQPGITENVTGRLLQMIFVVIAALLPALLYFLYDRQKVNIVSKTFYREIVRLDPTIHTSVDAEQKYGHLINEVYGDKSAGYYLANVGLPITLSSVLIALGWLLLLLPIIRDPLGLGGFFSIGDPAPPTALSFGFLGAYFFTLNMVFKRYVRSDLTPKAYSHITVRLLTTTILVWAVSILPAFQTSPQSSPQLSTGNSTPVLLILAFIIGIVPETAIKILQEFMRKTVGIFSKSLEERDPLTELEGIDLYDRARLSEEGVDNIENLAHHNLIDLLVQTRIPARRLVDMVDQAILYLYLRDSRSPGQPEAGSNPDLWTTAEKARKSLRYYGIRTATDLLRAWPTSPNQTPSKLQDVLQEEELANRINLVAGTLKEAEWVPQLLYRRALVTQRPKTPVTKPDKFFEEETNFAAELIGDLTEEDQQPASTKAGTGFTQTVASVTVVETPVTSTPVIQSSESLTRS